jgi:hypothetical protein
MSCSLRISAKRSVRCSVPCTFSKRIYRRRSEIPSRWPATVCARATARGPSLTATALYRNGSEMPFTRVHVTAISFEVATSCPHLTMATKLVRQLEYSHKGRRLFTCKALSRPPLCWSIFSLTPSLCAPPLLFRNLFIPSCRSAT